MFLEDADKLVDEVLDDIVNDETLSFEDDEVEDESTEPVSHAGKNGTKGFSERLNKERDKLAKTLGYASWQDALEKKQNSALLDQGLDPETVKPILKELMQQDPDYQAAIEYKKAKEKTEQKVWAENEIKKINDRYGLSLSSVNDLDKEVVDLWNGGLSLEKAYAAVHYEELLKTRENQTANRQTGTSHMVHPGRGGASKTGNKKLTMAEMEAFRLINPEASDDEINSYINK